MICCICEEETDTPYETPPDPPFFPAEGGKHCQACEDWLNGKFDGEPTKKAEELAREIREAEKDRKDPDVPARGRPEHRSPKD